MANISFFYPEKKKGFALGLNAAGGNLGVSVAQLVVPLAVIIGVPSAAVKLTPHTVHLAHAGLVWLPFIAHRGHRVVLLHGQPHARPSPTPAPLKASMKHSHTWIMSVLYIGTFGSFIGFSFAMPLVIKNTFPEFLASHPFIATYLAGLGFTGALVGSISRPFGGWLADRFGGARVTLGVFVGMVAATLVAISGVRDHSFAVFFGSFQVLFFFSGMGNGSTYKMIPSIFQALGRRAAAKWRRRPADRAGLQAPGRRRHRCHRRDRRLRRRAHPSGVAPSQPERVGRWSPRRRHRPRSSPSPRSTPTGRCPR